MKKLILILMVVLLVVYFLQYFFSGFSGDCICGGFSGYNLLDKGLPEECDVEFETLDKPIVKRFWHADCCHRKPENKLVEHAPDFVYSYYDDVEWEWVYTECAQGMDNTYGKFRNTPEMIYKDTDGNIYYYYTGNV